MEEVAVKELIKLGPIGILGFFALVLVRKDVMKILSGEDDKTVILLTQIADDARQHNQNIVRGMQSLADTIGKVNDELSTMHIKLAHLEGKMDR